VRCVFGGVDVVVHEGDDEPHDGEHEPADHEREYEEEHVPAPFDVQYGVVEVAHEAPLVSRHVDHVNVKFAVFFDEARTLFHDRWYAGCAEVCVRFGNCF